MLKFVKESGELPRPSVKDNSVVELPEDLNARFPMKTDETKMTVMIECFFVRI